MLERLGFKHFAYDWRAEHIPTFDAELEAIKRHHIALDAFWVAPGELNRESRIILDVLQRHGTKAQLWVLLDLGADRATGPEQERRVEAAATKLRPLAAEAEKVGCTLALYNHGGWFGEPENQIAIIERLKRDGVTNIGIVYNLHHGHDHLDRLPALLAKMMPYLRAVNLNGMEQDGEKNGRKILPLAQGALDLELLRVIVGSGYQGPIGILGHTMDDAEDRLRDNLDGLDWLAPQLEGKPAGARPKPRTVVQPLPPPRDVNALAPASDQPALVTALLNAARQHGDARRGAAVFASPQFACLSCHRVGAQGGTVGPDLTQAGACLKPGELVESILWPKKQIKQGYEAIAVATTDGKIRQGYKQAEIDTSLTFRDPTSGELFQVSKADIEETRALGTLMPDGLAAAMSEEQRRDLVRFLLELGGSHHEGRTALAMHAHAPAKFTFDRAPVHPEQWPGWQLPVNRERLYDFYAKEAEYFLKQPSVPMLLPTYPGLDGGSHGHWGNQSEQSWADDRWKATDLGTVLCGVFRGAGVTVPKGVCVRLGDDGELAACFNPETLCYEALWRGGFVTFSATRHGIMDGLLLAGTPLPRPEGTRPDKPFVYRGFYRHGKRVIFAYRIGDQELLDAPWVENGRFTRIVAPAASHPLAALVRGGAPSGRRLSRPAASWARRTAGRMWSTRSHHRFKIPGKRSSSTVTTTSLPTAARWSARSRATYGTWRGSTNRSSRCAGDGLRRGCTRRWDWLSRIARSTCSAAIKLPGCTTWTATARPTGTSVSAMPTKPRRADTILSAGSSAIAAAAFISRPARTDYCGSQPTARRSRCWRRASETPTAWAWLPTARSPCPSRRANGFRPR